MAVESSLRNGIGKRLVARLAEQLATERVEVLSVKTSAGPLRPDVVDTYGQTRAFYESVGFLPQMIFDIWETDVMLRPLRVSRKGA